MTLYRGIGGGGNATVDTELNLFTTLSQQAAQSATNASASEVASEAAALAAADSAEAAANSAAAAETFNPSSSLVTYLPAGTGAVETTVQNKLRETISVNDFASLPLSSWSATLKVAMEAAQASGKKLIIPARTYPIASVVAPTMTADLEVGCEAGAVFVADAALNNRMFFFNKLTGADISLRWTGGRTDMSAVGLGGGGTAWDHFYIGEKFDGVHFDGVECYSGEDYNANHADSGIFAVCRRFHCTRSRFQGLWDSAIYLSGDSAETNGEDAAISGNSFIKCRVGVISKRRYRRYVVMENFFDRCDTGIATGEADGTRLAGTNNIIVGNHIVQPRANGISAIIGDGSVISDNRIEDQGYDLNDTIVAAGSNGIRLAGSANCVVANNWIGMRRFATGGSGHRGIILERRTYNGVDYDSTLNLIQGNRIVGVNQGVRENDANQNANRILFNVISGAGTRIAKGGGAASFYAEFTTETGSRLDLVGAVSLGGSFGSESFRVTPVAGSVDFLQATGSTAGAPVLQAIGASTNIDIRMIAKGTGLLRYGVHTANADAPITGYVAIKTDDGVTRKLAVIA